MNKYLIFAFAISLFSTSESISSGIPGEDDVGSGPRAQSSKSTRGVAAAEEPAAILKGTLQEENLRKNLEELRKINAEKEAKYKQEQQDLIRVKASRDKEAAENQRLREELENLREQIREQERLSSSVVQQDRVRQQSRAKK